MRILPLIVMLCLFSACQSPDCVYPPMSLGTLVAQLEQVDVSEPHEYARDLWGRPLIAPPPDEPARTRMLDQLHEAIAHWRTAPEDEQAIIWIGRRVAYMGRFDDACAVFTAGLDVHPDSPRLLRHRGHRFITTRRFVEAERDLARAAELVRDRPDEVEPDGQPNAANTPRSTLNTNILYHLGLAHYLQGDFRAAAASFADCITISPNDDMIVAAAYWAFLCRARADGLAAAAPSLARITPQMDVIENRDYHWLCLHFKGEPDVRDLDPVDPLRLASVGYGLAAYCRLRGGDASGIEMLRTVRAGAMPAAFGAIAAEADLHRVGAEPPPLD